MATGAYDANGIWQYGEDDNIALFSDLLNLGTESTSDAFTDDRARLATLEAGSLSGLIPVSPSSVDKSGGTASVNTLGVVTFSGVASVSLNSVFTSSYKNYRVMMNITGSLNPTVPGVRLRASSADYSGSTYNYAGASGRTNGAIGNWTANSATFFDLGRINTGASTTSLEFYAPQEPVWTEGTFTSSHVDNSGFLMATVCSLVAATNQFDGFTFYAVGGGTVSGSIQCFGYND